MTDFRFAHPELLCLLLALPILGAVLSRINKRAMNKLLHFMAEANLRQLLQARGALRDRGKKLAFWAGLVFLILAAARPQANPITEELRSTGLDIYALLDVSRSMDAEDIAPSRLKKAKKTIQHLTSRLSGDRVGIIAYANSAVLVTPLTSDYSIIDTYLKNIDTTIIPSQGTNVGHALEVAREAMARGAKSSGDEQDRSNIFLVLSDGEDHGESDLSVADEIRASGGLIFSIAFGTERGAPIPIRDEKGELRGYKTDSTRNPVLSAMKPQVLQEASRRGGGHFYFSTLEETEVNDILARVGDAQRGSFAKIKATVYEEWFPLFLAPAIALLLFSFLSIRALIKFVSAKLPRRHFKKMAAGVAVAMVTLPTPTEANPLAFFWTKEKRATQESSELAKQNKFAEAVDSLKGLQAENPDSPELGYNIGTYLLQDKKYAQGREHLSRLRSADMSLRLPALFNVAGSFAQEGDKSRARAAYAELLHLLAEKQGKTEEDNKLIALAKRNLERLANESQQSDQKKQDQEQKQESKSGEGDGKDQKKQEGDQGKNDNKQGENKQGENKQGENKQGESKQDNRDGKQEKKPEDAKEESKQAQKWVTKPFQERDTMGEEDAKRILGALKERESGLQKKFLKDKAKGGKVNADDAAKDW